MEQLFEQFDNRETPSFYWNHLNNQPIRRCIQRFYKKNIEILIGDADQICEHVFDLLGSGKVSLGKKINWHRDFKSGYCWQVKFYTAIGQIRLQDDSDVKVPRELSRCQHFLTLGRAYFYTQNEKYAAEFVSQLIDWIEANPPWMGINWCNAMEVAIRLVNWIWAYHFFGQSAHFNNEIRKAFLKSIYLHAQFIDENLEYYGEFSNNHYLANIVGLLVFAVLFPEFRSAKRWKMFAVKELFHEMENQLYPDGVSFEGSISYHRLALELFCSALIICRKNNIDIPDNVWRRLEGMFEYTLYYSRPDGLSPQIGDTDNARVQILGPSEIMDHRYLLAVGAVLFQRADFKHAAGFFHEEAFWLLGKAGFDTFEAIPVNRESLLSKGFAQSGVYFLRNKDLYMAIDCGPNGRRGRGDHSHNDTLSFEIYAYDKAFIIDPGTYVYTADHQWRHKFRSTAFHNTVMVDGEEMNRIVPELPFETNNDAIPKVHQWKSTPACDLLDAEHNGYARLREPVVHRRQVYFDKQANYWVIRDLLTGRGQHQLCWHFHFDKGITVARRDDVTVETHCGDGANLMLYAVSDKQIFLEIEEGWVSPSYGIKDSSQVARFVSSAVFPMSVTYLIYPYLGNSQLPVSLTDILRHFEQACGAAR